MELIHFFGESCAITLSDAQPWPNFPDLNGARPSYLRKSASICGSSRFFLYSCRFAVKVGSLMGERVGLLDERVAAPLGMAF
jgi:hypothetical protein